MTDADFERISQEAARALVMRSAVVIKNILDNEEEASIGDAVRVYEAANKRLGLYANEKRENLPTIHWTINGGSVTIAMENAAPAAPVVEAEDAVEVTVKEVTPEEAFSLSFDGVESMKDDL